MTAKNATALRVVPSNRFTQTPTGGHTRTKPEVKKKNKTKEASKPKVYVLDTNVLIDDPDAINQFGNNFVVIPITVVRELEKKKGELFSARHAIKALYESNAGDEFIPLKNGGKIKIEIVTETLNGTNDDIIMSVALSYKSKNYGDVVFVTNDLSAGIIARRLGITTETYRTNEVDIDKFQIEKAEQGFGEIDKKIVYENGYIKPYVPAYWKAKGVTENLAQEKAIQDLFDEKKTFVALLGQAGTGKTMIAILSGLSMVTSGEYGYEKVIVTKPVVAVGGNDIGFLPGTKEDKMGPWVAPIRDHVDKFLREQYEKERLNVSKPKIPKALTQKQKKTTANETIAHKEKPLMTFDSLVGSGIIEIEAEAFIRGRSFENVIVVIDEGQNFSASAAKTWMTRMGDGSKLIMTGDVTQIDTPYLSKSNNALSHSAVKTDGQIWASTIFLDLGVRSIMSDWAANNL